MLIALEKDDGSLFLFDSTSDAEAAFETIDVENDEYEFCDDTGQRFVGEITAPVHAFRTGSYRLRPSGSPGRQFISDILARANRSVESLTQARRISETADIVAALAHAEDQRGHPELAITHYRRALEIDPTHFMSQQNLQRLYQGGA